MDIAFALYDNFTALDLVGPYEVLSAPESRIPHSVAASLDTVVCDFGLPVRPTTTFAELTRPDIVVVPGSSRPSTELDTAELTSWLAAVHPTTTWAASVCTGSILLALEYDPQPPFDSGSPDKASPEPVAALREGVLPA